MTWVDLTVFGFLGVSGLLAFVRGFVREVLGVGAWAGAAAAAVVSRPWMREFVDRWVATPVWDDLISYIVVFLITLIVLMLTANGIGRLVRGSALGGIDRTLGLLFGLMRGTAVVIVAFILVQLVFPHERWPDAMRNALTLKPTYEAAHWVWERIPVDYRPHLDPLPPELEITAEALQHVNPQGRATGKQP